MKLKLFHKLFLLVAVTALVAALAMASVMAWNLSRGFAGYLESRDIETLETYAELISRELDERGGIEALETGSITLAGLHDDMAREGLIPGMWRSIGRRRSQPPSGSGPQDLLGGAGGLIPSPPSRSQGPDRPELANGRERPFPPPPGGGNRAPGFLAPRLLLFDTRGEQIAGPPPPSEDGPEMMERTISSDGKIVATARMISPGVTSGAVDARFLRSQYVNAALLVVALMIFAALAAWWFARAGTRRLANMEIATREIAHGNFNVRTDPAGHDEVSMMAHDINQMAESLSRADQARRGWLAEIGHELRTPLTVLAGELDALKDGIRPLNQAAVSSLQEETDRLGALIEDLHFMAVSDLTQAPSSFSAYDAITLLGVVEDRFMPVLAKAGLTLEVDLGGETALPVVWDGKRIEQLLGNLLTNAIRYTDAPGVVRIGIANTEDFITITVEDSPPGVPADALPRLFEPLFRVDEARDRASGGSGLGLAVCRAIADAHGGSISSKRSKLGGLLVEVKLPVKVKRS